MENFVITIARQYGSGGRTVGKMLAEKLGVSFYDKQIIQMASDESGIDVKLFGQVEEGSSVKASLFNKTGLYKGDLIAPDQKGFVSDENIFNYQAKIATDLAEKESCVIVGRCVNYVFKDRPNTLRVFVHAPWEFRVEKSREKISGSDEEIEKFLRRDDKRKQDYYRKFAGGDWSDATNYDLCLNAGKHFLPDSSNHSCGIAGLCGSHIRIRCIGNQLHTGITCIKAVGKLLAENECHIYLVFLKRPFHLLRRM